MTCAHIPTSHVGSLIRPAEFAALLRRRSEGGVDTATYEAALRDSVAAIVKRQAEIGIDVVSDGEFGKGISWAQYALERLDGFEHIVASREAREATVRSGVDYRRFPEFYAEYMKTENLRPAWQTPKVWRNTGPISYRGQAAIGRDIDNFKAALADTGAQGFMPAVAPTSALALTTNEHYETERDYLFATAAALHTEYRAIIDAGFVLQVDDAHLPLMYDRMVPPASLAEYRDWAGMRIDALNHALNGLPQERIRYHVCWGSWNGPHTHDVPLEDILDLVLRVNAGTYSLEMANPRHEHEWQVWRENKLPQDKKLMPGVISHATNVVEHPRLVAERLVRLAKLVGRERVIAGTDCGFAQGPFVQRVPSLDHVGKARGIGRGRPSREP